MVTIYNSDVSKELREGTKAQTARDVLPSQLAEKVVPVMEVNPKLLKTANIVLSNSRNTTGSLSITLPAVGRKTYISSLTINVIQNATCDIATGFIFVNGTFQGTTATFAALPVITLTALTIEKTISFPTPIELDEGTSITLGGTFTAGICLRSISITAYTIDNPRS
jgi:hypothetical protein